MAIYTWNINSIRKRKTASVAGAEEERERKRSKGELRREESLGSCGAWKGLGFCSQGKKKSWEDCEQLNGTLK